MKRILLPIGIVLVVLSGCGGANEVQKEFANAATNEEKPLSLENYKPESGITKEFIQSGEFPYTETIIASKGNLIQKTVQLGDMKSLEIQKWTSKKVEKVYQEANPQEETSRLDKFKSVEAPELLISSQKGKGKTAKWEIIEEGATLTTPYKEFTNVLVVKKTTDELADADTIYTRYYAPGVGMIKDVYEVTGEEGYKVETILQNITK
ncbi:hypothetical protein [Alkalihalobacillus sp. AL-G]|uniref:hypothetical protein n=1 Tax=Alkalihalobacillus sp. AL-G TaxID=2926399 RepID=UPI00272C0B63|nr:hypothetical protein [Alkalihalobacillus sp. AL-G]WLD92994.1 hypothetical protein MOJ78_18640 [Alkalihalobacillus sp. AL-G]